MSYGEVFAAAMNAVHRQDVEDACLLLVRANPLGSRGNDRDGEGASVVKNSLVGDDLAQSRKSGPVRR